MTGGTVARYRLPRTTGHLTYRNRNVSPDIRATSGTCLNEVLESEMKRAAQSLHDGAGQLLAVVHIKLDQVIRNIPTDQASHIQAVKLLLEEMEERLRTLSHELRPTVLDDLGLMAALDFLAAGVSRRTGLNVNVSSRLCRRLPGHLETVLYRIIQSRLEDVASCARVKRVRISISLDRQIRCVIWDDGVPSNAEEQVHAQDRGLGISAIRDRVEALAGEFAAVSTPTSGTELRISIPLNE